jgi:hypothetical protein
MMNWNRVEIHVSEIEMVRETERHGGIELGDFLGMQRSRLP